MSDHSHAGSELLKIKGKSKKTTERARGAIIIIGKAAEVIP